MSSKGLKAWFSGFNLFGKNQDREEGKKFLGENLKPSWGGIAVGAKWLEKVKVEQLPPGSQDDPVIIRERKAKAKKKNRRKMARLSRKINRLKAKGKL